MSFRRRKGLGGEESPEDGPDGRDGEARAPEAGRVRTWGVAAAIVAVTALGGYLVAAEVLFPAPSAAGSEALVTVPELRGSSLEEARSTLSEGGLDLQIAARLPAPDADDGEVLAQRPPGGQRAGAGDTVSVTVAAPEGLLPVPAVRALLEERARTVLSTMGFRVDTTRESASVPRGEVVRTVPAAGEPAAPGTRVQLVLSQGPPVVGVPELMGRHVDDVRSILADSGLALGAVSYDSAAIAAPGRIIGQSPPAGFALREGERVTVRVAGSSPDTLGVPGGGR